MEVNVDSLKGWRTFAIFFCGLIGGIVLMAMKIIPSEIISLEAYTIFITAIGGGYGAKSVLETKFKNSKNPTG